MVLFPFGSEFGDRGERIRRFQTEDRLEPQSRCRRLGIVDAQRQTSQLTLRRPLIHCSAHHDGNHFGTTRAHAVPPRSAPPSGTVASTSPRSQRPSLRNRPQSRIVDRALPLEASSWLPR